MSLDKFQLPSDLLPELYKDSLVVLDAGQIFSESLKAENISYRGGFQKRILILSEGTADAASENKKIAFLEAILKACLLDWAHIAFIENTADLPIDSQETISQLNPSVLISFGVAVDSENAGVSGLYEVSQLQQIKFLKADSLHTISEDNEKKKALWGGLKNIFSLT